MVSPALGNASTGQSARFRPPRNSPRCFNEGKPERETRGGFFFTILVLVAQNLRGRTLRSTELALSSSSSSSTRGGSGTNLPLDLTFSLQVSQRRVFRSEARPPTRGFFSLSVSALLETKGKLLGNHAPATKSIQEQEHARFQDSRTRTRLHGSGSGEKTCTGSPCIMIAIFPGVAAHSRRTCSLVDEIQDGKSHYRSRGH